MKVRQLPLKEISIRITKGTTPTTMGRPFVEEGINFIKAEALNGDTNLDESGFAFIDEETHQLLQRSILEENDVLVTIAGANTGKCGFVRESDLPANTNQAVGIVRINHELAKPRFIYYFFKQKKTFDYIQTMSAQAAQPNLNLTNLGKIRIALPPRNVQIRIASILSAYDDLIENNRRRIQLLEQSARLLYKEWFVRLRFPGHEHVKIKDGVPEGWERKKIGDICETVGGGTPSTRVSEYWDGDITWVVPSDITKSDSLVLLHTERKITEKGLRESSAKMVPSETILMTSRASVGFFALMDFEVCTNQGFINILPYKDELRMYLLFNFMSRVAEIRSNAKGTTYPEISKGRFREMDIVVPSKTLLGRFSKVSTDVIRQMRYLKRSILQLEAARDLLLPRLMNGETTV